MAPVSVVVIGAGERGSGYARWAARHPDRALFAAEQARLNGTVETISY